MSQQIRQRDILVIGASYGGVSALQRLVAHFPADLAAAVFVVHHLTPTSQTILHEILRNAGLLPAVLPEDGEEIRTGTIYVARPNHHLLLKENRVRVVFGPRENRWRPSIDALFRSAAAYHTTRVVAALLTGYLYDGVSGLGAVKRCGGTAMVQDPAEAEVPELPEAAINRVQIDHVLPLDELSERIIDIVGSPAGEPVDIPEEIMEDVKVAEHEIPKLARMHELGDLTPYTCPECGGVLWNMKNEPVPRYRCHTGHSFTTKSFLEGQAEMIENSLWITIRYVQERIDVLVKLVDTYRREGKEDAASNLEKKISEMTHHIRTIRRFILSGLLGSAMGDSAAAEEGKT